MSLAITIKLTDTATPAVNRLRQLMLKTEPVNKRIGEAVTDLVRLHLMRLGPNKRGWPSTGFWRRASDVTSYTSDASGAVVSINQIGVRQRYYGGPIRPVNKRFLTIPLGPESYGKVASDFPSAFLLKTKKGAYLVQRGQSISAAGNVVKAKGKGYANKRTVAALEFLFKLSSGVFQKENTDVLPPERAITNAALTEVERAVEEAIA